MQCCATRARNEDITLGGYRRIWSPPTPAALAGPVVYCDFRYFETAIMSEKPSVSAGEPMHPYPLVTSRKHGVWSRHFAPPDPGTGLGDGPYGLQSVWQNCPADSKPYLPLSGHRRTKMSCASRYRMFPAYVSLVQVIRLARWFRCPGWVNENGFS